MTERKFVTYYISDTVLISRLLHYACIGFSSQLDVSLRAAEIFKREENREVLPPAGDTMMSQRAFVFFCTGSTHILLSGRGQSGRVMTVRMLTWKYHVELDETLSRPRQGDSDREA